MRTLTVWIAHYGRSMTVAAAVTGACLAALSPGLKLVERVAAPCSVFLSTAIVYGTVMVLLGAFAKVSLAVLRFFGYAIVVVGLSCVLSIPLYLAEGGAKPGQSGLESAVWIGAFVAMGLAASWAAAVVLCRKHVLPNTSLERTREE